MRIAGVPVEVEPITAFEQLRGGVFYWVRTVSCTKHLYHRRWLFTYRSGPYHDILSGQDESGPYWVAEPRQKCSLAQPCITPDVVTDGRVFREVDEVMDAERDTIARVRKLSQGPVTRAYEKLLKERGR